METTPLLTVAETCAFLNIRPGTQDARVAALIAAATAQIERSTGRYFTNQTFTEYMTTRDNQRTDYDFAGSSDYAVAGVGNYGTKTMTDPRSFPLRGIDVDPTSIQCWYAPYARSQDDYNTQTALGACDFALNDDQDNPRVYVFIGTRFRPRALKIVYTGGYVPAATPAPTANDPNAVNPNEITLSASAPDYLKTAALIQCQFLAVKLRQDNIGMAAERTTSGEKGRIVVSAFLKTNGLTDEAIGLVAHLKRPGMGRG